MKLTINRNALTKALASVTRAIERKSTVPILANALLSAEGGSLMIAGTDLDLECRASCEAEIAQQGKTTVPAPTLYDICRKLPDGAAITLEMADEGRLLLKSGRARFTLQTLPASDFPEVHRDEFPHRFTVNAGAIAKQFGRVAFAISTEETRYYLNGVYLSAHGDKLRMVATDGHRLGLADSPLPEGAAGIPGVIVSRKSVQQFEKMLADCDEATFSLSTRSIRLEAGSVTMTAKLVDGSFPDYNRVIPSSHSLSVTLPCKELAAAVARVSTVVSERGRAVKCHFDDGKVTLSVRDASFGDAHDEIEAEMAGKPLEIGFNSAYLADLLTHIDAESCSARFLDAGSPAMFTPLGSAEQMILLMPMRV